MPLLILIDFRHFSADYLEGRKLHLQGWKWHFTLTQRGMLQNWNQSNKLWQKADINRSNQWQNKLQI